MNFTRGKNMEAAQAADGVQTNAFGRREIKEEPQKIPADEMAKVIMSVEGDGLKYHTLEDIGRYTVFPERHWKRMFPNQMFGNYE
jgi:hypothetical protein